MLIHIDLDDERKPRVTRTDTGEILDITDLVDAREDVQAAVYGQLAQIASNISTLRTQMKDQIEQRFHEGAIESAKYYGGVKMTRTATRRWDADRARKVLQRLADAGEITEARALAAVPIVEVPKADGKKLNALLSEFSGTDAGADLASTKTEAINWKSEIVEIEDVPVADDQAETPVAAEHPADAFFEAGS
ncbi:unannotated protein [freshwater metagenome]|uniref:Unannotated protein n=1 Tax=freshwater metagenome TaxID=449393 RepID=A0A6J7FRE8_9ZZZZ|nr:hypothetical protein [Actinomycetota bacterium]